VTEARPSSPGADGDGRTELADADADDHVSWSARGGWPQPRQQTLGWPYGGDPLVVPVDAAPASAPPAPAPHGRETTPVEPEPGRVVQHHDERHDAHRHVDDDDDDLAPEPEPGALRAKGRSSAPQVVGPLISSLRHPVLALLPIVALLALGIGAALGTPAVHTAQAQVLVGRVDVESTAVPGFVAANENLAGLYARIAETSVIAAPVGAALGLSSGQVLSQVAASPIPETSIVRVEASSDNSQDAVVLAAEVAAKLITYVEGNSVRPAGVETSLEDFETASAELLEAQDELAAARTALDGAATPSAAQTQTVVRAQAAVDTRQLRVDALAAAFRDTERGSGFRNSLQLIGEPDYVGTDTRSQVMLAVAFGVLVGLLLGTALATARENWPVLADVRARARRTRQ
jgi:hypothetical protein